MIINSEGHDTDLDHNKRVINKIINFLEMVAEIAILFI